MFCRDFISKETTSCQRYVDDHIAETFTILRRVVCGQVANALAKQNTLLLCRCAAKLMQQAGTAFRHYVGFVEDLCIQELKPAAEVGLRKNLLAPQIAIILASNCDSAAVQGATDLQPSVNNEGLGVSDVVVMTRALAVKLNNLEACTFYTVFIL